MVEPNRPVGISLVVATVGRTTELRRLFASLIKQTARHFEVIVVDQNGDARLEPILREARTFGLMVRSIEQAEKNLSSARNNGLRAAMHDIVAFPDDDCWYEVDVIGRVLDTFDSDPKLGGVVGRWAEPGGPNVDSRPLSWRRMQRFREISVSSIQVFFRRDLVRDVGGFDETLGVGLWFGAGEESDLVMRIVGRGERVLYTPQILVHHPWGSEPSGSISSCWTRSRSRARGTGALYAKHHLSPYIVIRGLLAPVLRCFIPPYRMRNIAVHLATALGRWEGYLSWRPSRAGRTSKSA